MPLQDNIGVAASADQGTLAGKPADDGEVVLLDRDGRPIGRERKSLVHHSNTPLHLAFSLYVFDPAGRVLMTRRALTKLTWPGVWTNSCCGHPAPEEDTEGAIARRLKDELNLTVSNLACVLPTFSYRARDASGVWENEICPVYSGTVDSSAELRAAPAEVMEYQWTEWDDLTSAAQAAPYAFSPWAVLQIAALPRPS